jgi:cytochrome c-type biogenesis protein CcmH/NrfF/cytochrome c-type biogenesis protein CcmH/NrfG
LVHAASTPDVEDRTREIATELRCVVCQNLSVADSPSEMAQQMRAIVREQVEAGKSAQEIKEFFVSKYGEWVLLKPKTTGISALLWILPYLALLLGVGAALLFLRRLSTRKKIANETSAPVTITDQTRQELLRRDLELPDLEDRTARAGLLRERARISAELSELEFDFESGKLSREDYQTLKNDIEAKGAAVIQQLGAMPSVVAAPAQVRTARSKPDKVVSSPSRFPRWQLVSGGIFLLAFGIALGVMLTQSIRPRGGEGDIMTGDFMTGTTPSNRDAAGALAQGKQAFAQQDFPKAIDAFKKVLASDPNHPEAHSYMGFILMQASHGDGALMAFDKALSQAPNFPMALWGKGMVLYQDKKDFAAAREIFEKLLTLVPPGEERNEIAKVLAEIPSGGGATKPIARPSPAAGSRTVSGKIILDPKLTDKIDPQASLFIIARSAGSAGGPPLAVKKIDRPTFPLNYSLGQENVMMQGTPFDGKIHISVRLDKDGNPATRGAGDLTGEYTKNPVEVGVKSVDIVIDQMAR